MPAVKTIQRVVLSMLLAAVSGIQWADAGEPVSPKPTGTTPAAKPEELPELPRAPLEDGVFMQTGDTKIMLKDVDKILLLMLTDEKKRYPKNTPSADRILQGRVEIAQNLLLKTLIMNYAAEHKLSSTSDTVDRFIDLKRSELQRQGTSYEQMLIDEGWSDAEFRKFWSAKLAIERYASEKLTKEEFEAFFNLNKDALPLRSAAHILYQYTKADAAPRTLKRTKEEARKMAEDTLAKLKAGTSFAELAQTSDEDKNKASGGQLDFFPLKGEKAMVEAFGKAVYALKKVGDLADVVESPFGFHVIKLTGIRDDEYRVDLRRYLVSQKFNELLQPVMIKTMEAAKFNSALTKIEK